MNIEVNDYIRTKQGKIYTVKGINVFADRDMHYLVKESVVYVRANEIVKHSNDILDLIEAGDILEYTANKVKCIGIVKEQNGLLVNGWKLKQLNIKTILTQEK